MGGHPSQARTIRSQLLWDMRQGAYAGRDRLPRESVLAETLGISRTQLRDILASLEREGFITRRHGVGTVINRRVLEVPCRMDIEVEFLDMIRQAGCRAEVASVRASLHPAGEEIAARLEVDPETEVLRVDRLCTADGRPAIYCEDYLVSGRIRGPYREADLKLPIFHFLGKFCGVTPYLDLTDLRPITADPALADILQVDVGAPVLFMDEVDYDIDGAPVFCSREYFADGIFRHTVLRKKL